MKKTTLGLCMFFALAVVAGCATFHQNVEDGAEILFEYDGFTPSRATIGKSKPYIYSINGKHVTGGAFRSEYKIPPGDHSAHVRHNPGGFSTPVRGDVKFSIPSRDRYKVIITKGDVIRRMPRTVDLTAEVVPLEQR